MTQDTSVDKYPNPLASRADLPADLVACERDLVGAMLSRDVSTLDDLLADGYTYVSPEGVVSTKEQDLARYRGGLKLTRAQHKSFDAQVQGTTAVAVTRMRMEGRFGDAAFEIDMIYTRTYVKAGRRWRVLSAHGSYDAAS